MWKWVRRIKVASSGAAVAVNGIANTGVMSDVTINLLTGAQSQPDTVDPDVLAMLQRQASVHATEDYSTRFLPSAMASIRAHSWDFVGRREALRAIVSWLAANNSRLLASIFRDLGGLILWAVGSGGRRRYRPLAGVVR